VCILAVGRAFGSSIGRKFELNVYVSKLVRHTKFNKNSNQILANVLPRRQERLTSLMKEIDSSWEATTPFSQQCLCKNY
jgi:hypothetical protein